MLFKNFTKIILAILISTITFSVSASNSAGLQKIEKAKDFINKFQKLSHNYDEELIHMYSDNAKIIRIVEKDDGKSEKYVLPVEGYKNMLKYVSFFAKLRGYKNHYKELSYKIEDGNVRITGKRINNSGYTAPVSLLVGKNQNAEWKILEERTKTESAFLVKQVFNRMD